MTRLRWPRIPLRRFGDPLSDASAAVFPASEAAGCIAGQNLHAEGGLVIQA
jgi:NAD(P)-dependent dehydrogenase (short-subunit alcohol dehydrogenase family)